MDKKQLVDRFGNPLVSKSAASAKYDRSHPHRWGHGLPLDLPRFSLYAIEFMLVDPTIQLGLAARQGPIRAAAFGYQKGNDWEYGVKSDREDVKDFVERQLHQVWTYELPKLLESQVYGWACCEVVHKLVEDADTGNSRVEVDELKTFRPFDASPLEDPETGHVVGVEVRSSQLDGSGQLRLEVPGKAIWCVHNKAKNPLFGDSVLRGSYSPFADKWFDGGALPVRRLYMHTEAFAGMRIRYPEGTTYVEGIGDVPNWELAQQMVDQYRSGNVMTLPSTVDEQGKLLWEVIDAKSGPVPTHIFDYPKELDTEELRGMGIPDDVLESEGMSGAWAGKKVPMESFLLGLQGWGNDILDSVVRHIIEPLVQWNWGEEVDFEVGLIPFRVQSEKMQQEAMQAQQGGGLGGLFGGEETGGFGEGPDQPQSPMLMAVKENARELRLSCDIPSRDNEYSTAMLDLPGAKEMVKSIAGRIRPDDLIEIEQEPHVTLKYGLHANTPDQLKHILRNEGPVALRLGATAAFENDDEDVLYLAVESQGVRHLNGVISNACPHTDTYPVYQPHVTVARLQPGTACQYVGITDALGQSFVCNAVTFSDPHRHKSQVLLKGAVRFGLDNNPKEFARKWFRKLQGVDIEEVIEHLQGMGVQQMAAEHQHGATNAKGWRYWKPTRRWVTKNTFEKRSGSASSGSGGRKGNKPSTKGESMNTPEQHATQIWQEMSSKPDAYRDAVIAELQKLAGENRQPVGTSDELARQFKELQDGITSNVDVPLLRKQFAELFADQPKRVLTEVARNLGRDYRGTKREVYSQLLGILEAVATSKVQVSMIGSSPRESVESWGNRIKPMLNDVTSDNLGSVLDAVNDAYDKLSSSEFVALSKSLGVDVGRSAKKSRKRLEEFATSLAKTAHGWQDTGEMRKSDQLNQLNKLKEEAKSLNAFSDDSHIRDAVLKLVAGMTPKEKVALARTFYRHSDARSGKRAVQELIDTVLEDKLVREKTAF